MLSTIPSGERRFHASKYCLAASSALMLPPSIVSMGSSMVLTAESVKTTHVRAVGCSCMFAQMVPLWEVEAVVNTCNRDLGKFRLYQSEHIQFPVCRLHNNWKQASVNNTAFSGS